MQSGKFGWIVIVALVVMIAAHLPAFAQGESYAMYMSDDGVFGFFYPADWDQEFDDYYLTVDLYFDEGGVYIYTPQALKDWTMDGLDAEGFLRLLAPDWELPANSVVTMGDSAYILVESEDEQGETYTDLLFATPLRSGDMVLMDAFVYDGKMPTAIDEIMLIASTMDFSMNGAQPVQVTDDMLSTVDAMVADFLGEAPTGDMTLSNYDGAVQLAITELHEAGLVPEGGRLLFMEEYAYFNGQGSFYAPLARNAPRTNFVMKAELAYKPSLVGGPETCVLGMRVNWAGDTTTAYTDVGYTNEGSVFYLDVPANGEQSIGVADATVSGDEAHTFTLVVIDDRMHVFVDGVLVLENIRVEPRAGSWGVGLTGQGPTALCEARNIWVYAFE